MWYWPKEKCPFLCLVFSPRQRCKEPCSLKYTWDTDELGQFFYFVSFYYILTCVCHELRYWSTSFSTESNSGSWVPSYKHLLDNVFIISDRIVKVFLKLVTPHPTFILGWLWIGGWSALIKRNFSSFSGISDGLGKPSLICDKKKSFKNLNLNLVFATMSLC